MNAVVDQPTFQSPALTSFQKGQAFEDYIISLIDNRSRRFRLLEWRSDKISSTGMFVESNSFPDLEFAYEGKWRQRFAIECKWRQRFYKGRIDWANELQIANYLKYQKEFNIPVFIAIGVGGQPNAPEKLFVTPLDQICHLLEVYESDLIPFNRDAKKRFFFDANQLKLF